jgi:hypothetical protein
MAKFVALSGLILFIAWLASTGRVAYVMVMLWLAVGLAFAVLDLVGYEIRKKERQP